MGAIQSAINQGLTIAGAGVKLAEQNELKKQELMTSTLEKIPALREQAGSIMENVKNTGREQADAALAMGRETTYGFNEAGQLVDLEAKQRQDNFQAARSRYQNALQQRQDFENYLNSLKDLTGMKLDLLGGKK